MIRNPLVSTIIPTYNRVHIICEAIDSVLAQTYSNNEIIVVDDGSIDNTHEVLQQYAARIRVFSQENAGPSSARNRGIRESKGDLIAFLDSDDLWLPTKLERQIALLTKFGSSVPCCLCNIHMKWRDREFSSFQKAWLNPDSSEGLWLNVDEVLTTRFVLFNQGVVVRRDVLERVGGFDERLRFLEDHDLALRLALEGPWAFIREPLVIWRETKSSLSKQCQSQDFSQTACIFHILQNLGTKLADRPGRRRLKRFVKCELKRARRQLLISRIRHMGFRGAALVASSLRMIERFRRGAYRRSPWFPKMKANPVEN